MSLDLHDNPTFRTSVISIPNTVFLSIWNTASRAKMLANPVPRQEILAFSRIPRYIPEIPYQTLCEAGESHLKRPISFSGIQLWTSNCFKLQQSIDQFSPLVTDILATLMWFPFKTTYSVWGKQKVIKMLWLSFFLGLIFFPLFQTHYHILPHPTTTGNKIKIQGYWSTTYIYN